jgi:shikimate dehydrogenase
VDDETTTIDRYGVMGYPISQSRSPVIHQLFARQTAQDLQYELLQVAPEKLAQAIRQFQRTGGRGLNITVPHKETVTSLCDQLSERANAAGAVNTLVFADGDVFGDNTDGIGLLRDLTANLRISLAGLRILVLGAGGATRGIVGPLLSAAPDLLLVANRTLQKAELIADRFSRSGLISACRFDEVPQDEVFDLVINATSAGITGDTPPYPASAVSGQTLCYDLSYGLKATPFCRWGHMQGAAQSVMGWGMLIEQAAESFHIWRGVRPDTAPVLKQLVPVIT